jgi:DNA-binding NarL/FixJ family response regulator
MLGSEPFSLLMTDLRMPGMDEFQVLAVVRRKFPTLRTIVMTQAVDEQYRTRAYSMGIDLYLEKPRASQEIKLFVDCIESLLDARGTGRLPRRAEQEPHGHHPDGVHARQLNRPQDHQRRRRGPHLAA